MNSPKVTLTSSNETQESTRMIDKLNKMVQELERKNHRLRQVNEEATKQLSEALQRGRRLAQSLGFEDVAHAQVSIDSADHELSLHECYQRIRLLEMELEGEKKEVEICQAKLRNFEAERQGMEKELNEASSKRSNDGTLREQLTVLQALYDDLKDTKERAAERYKSDYKKWRVFNKWLFAQEGQHRQDCGKLNLTPTQEKRRDIETLKQKRAMLTSMGLDLAKFEGEGDDEIGSSSPKRPPIGRIEMENDKENEETPYPPAKRRRVSTPSESSTSSQESRRVSLPLKPSQLHAMANMPAPSSSPTVFLPSAATPSSATGSRVPLSFQPVNSKIGPTDPESTLYPTPSRHIPSTLRRSDALTPRPSNSSDTEDDSQAVYMMSAKSNKLFQIPGPPKTQGTMTPEHKSSPAPSLTLPQSNKTYFPQLGKPTPLQFKIPSVPPGRSNTPQGGRMSTDFRELDEWSTDALSTPKHSTKQESPDSKSYVPSSTREKEIQTSSKSKAKERGIVEETTTPMPSSMKQKPVIDYSAFKGRGRYGKGTDKDDNSGEVSINAQYMINPDRNGGLDYQYDEVVRSKEARKKMDAGDCECCREYYQNVGPLPPRLQAPLWRSPPPTPAKPCAQHGHLATTFSHNHGGQDVDTHRKTISRHRHNWERAKTPPGYWNIGFPNTQEAGEINQKAKEMQRQKQDEIEKEVKDGTGRYRKK